MTTKNAGDMTCACASRDDPVLVGWMGIFAGMFYCAMEWLFIVTKPSFMNALPWRENVRILLLSPLPLVLAAVLTGFLLRGALRVAPGLGRLWTGIALLWPSGVIAATLLLMLDNFTYTLWRVGVLTTTRSRCYLYVGVILLLWGIAYVQCRRKLLIWKGRALPWRMSRISAWVLVLLWTSLLLAGYDRLRTARSGGHLAQRPNILLLTSDGVNAESMSLYGYERQTTPFMETFFRDTALVCENAFANCLNSSGSIASMLTGKLPTTLRLYYPPDILTGRNAYEHLPGILRQHGYYAADISVRHFADVFDLNLQNGFHEANGRGESRGIWRRLASYQPAAGTVYFLRLSWERLRDRIMHAMHWRRMESAHTILAEDLTGKQVKDSQRVGRLKQLIATSGSRPFFAHVHLLGTHGPVFRPRQAVFSAGRDIRSQGHFDRDFYDDAILDFDGMLREIVEALEQAGQLEHSILVVNSDHGRAFRNLRIPLVFRFPGGAHARRVTVNAQNVDIAPTLLDYLGLKAPAWMEGVSLLRNDPPAGRPVFCAATDSSAVDQRTWTLVQDRTTPPFHSLGVLFMNIGDHEHALNVKTGSFHAGRISGHKAPGFAGPPPPMRKAHDMLIEHLASKGFRIPDRLAYENAGGQTQVPGYK